MVELYEKVMKNCYNSFIFNVRTSEAQVSCKVIETTLLYKFFSSIGNLLWFLANKYIKILIVPSFRLKFDDVTVSFSLIVLS